MIKKNKIVILGIVIYLVSCAGNPENRKDIYSVAKNQNSDSDQRMSMGPGGSNGERPNGPPPGGMGPGETTSKGMEQKLVFTLQI